MTQSTQIIQLLREGPKTLGQFRNTTVFYELRSRISELRAQGYAIRHHKVRHCKACRFVDGEDFYDPARCPASQRGDNVYRLEGEPARVEANGQLVAW